MPGPLSELPAELIAGYAEVAASTLGHLGRTGYLPELKPVVANTRLLGRVVTARIPLPHGALLREALIASRPGDVLVIEAVGDPHCACWGELRTLAALIKGLAGVVVNGAITDVQALRQLGLPVFHRGISAVTTQGGEALGELNVELQLGETRVCPGDLALGDDDGLFVLSPARAAALLPGALAKEAADQARRAQLLQRLTEGR
jgi:regulator of RNase E activity RraA